MPSKKYVVDLSEAERQELLNYIQVGQGNKRQKVRAMILVRADEGMTDKEIVRGLKVARVTVERTRQRFVEGNIEGALKEAPRIGKKRFTGLQEAKIIALACSEAPVGQARWSLRLLADKAVELAYVESISHEQIRQTLKKTS